MVMMILTQTRCYYNHGIKYSQVSCYEKDIVVYEEDLKDDTDDDVKVGDDSNYDNKNINEVQN